MSSYPPNTCRFSSPRRRRCERRGSALILVLGLVAITLAVSYAMMRTQGTASQISANQDRRGDARQAALTALWVGFRKMHESGWSGPGTYDTAWLSDSEAYIVYYVQGDASLSPADPDYDQYPYRVTLVALGFGIDPENEGVISSYEMSAVVQLLPTALGSQPSGWNTMQNYTVYQTHQDLFELDFPYRILGPVRAQSQLRIARNYPTDPSARQRYFSDLGLMKVLGQGDYRPFNGPIYCHVSSQTSEDYNDLTLRLSVPVNNTSPSSMGADWVFPTGLTTYRLYPGGPSYNVQLLSGTLSNISLGPDPLTNPLGIFYSSAALKLGNNVTIRGSLLCANELRIEGTNVQFLPAEMMGLHGATGVYRLPVVACNKFLVKATGGGTLTGLLVAFDEFKIEKSSASTAFAITGRLVSRRILIDRREPWDTAAWDDLLSSFYWQYLLGQKYFPKWLKSTQGLDQLAKITIAPESGTITYDWFSFGGSTSILARDAGDNLLHWEVIEWNENL